MKFISQEIPISFEEVHHNIEDIANKKDSKFNDKLYFLYDKQSNRFIYIYDSNIYIFNHKGILEKSTKIDLIEKIKLAAVEYTCNYMLILTKSNQGIISDLNNNRKIDYLPFWLYILRNISSLKSVVNHSLQIMRVVIIPT